MLYADEILLFNLAFEKNETIWFFQLLTGKMDTNDEEAEEETRHVLIDGRIKERFRKINLERESK